MAKLFSVEAGKLNTFNGRFHEAGMTAEEVDLVQADKEAVLAAVMLSALRSHLKTADETEAERRRAAEEASRIIIMDSGYKGPPANEQRCKGPYFTYPNGWTPKSALARRDILKPLFPGVDFGRVEELAQSYYVDVPVASEATEGGYHDAPKNGRRLVLPEHADAGLIVFPKLAAAVKCVKKPKKGWDVDQIVAEYILGVFKEINPTFEGHTGGNVGPKAQCLLEHTAKILAKLDEKTPGDVHVQPFNAGACFAGYSVESSRGHMEALKTHMPATDFMGFCFALTDPGAFMNRSLGLHFPGTKRASRAGGIFSYTSSLSVCGGRFGCYSYGVGFPFHHYGSASVVLRVAVSPK